MRTKTTMTTTSSMIQSNRCKRTMKMKMVLNKIKILIKESQKSYRMLTELRSPRLMIRNRQMKLMRFISRRSRMRTTKRSWIIMSD